MDSLNDDKRKRRATAVARAAVEYVLIAAGFAVVMVIIVHSLL